MDISACIFKVIVIGESSVGKTSLIVRFAKGEYSPVYRATIGTDFLAKEVGMPEPWRHPVTLQLWDTAGQERFAGLSSAFYRGADACVLVFSLADRRTWQQVPAIRAEFLATAKVEHDPTFPFVLVGNKCDAGELRAVERSEIDAYVRDNALVYFETSAKDDVNVVEVFDRVAEITADDMIRRKRIEAPLPVAPPLNVATEQPKKGCCTLV